MKLIKEENYIEAAKIARDGGLIAFPTETVFGLGVIYDNKEAYDRLIKVKRRPPEKPFTLMCASIDDIAKYAELNEIAQKLINKFMPGEFTLITKAKNNLPSFAVSKEGNVGIRVPDFPLIQNLIKEVGKPLLVPSANKSGETPAHNSHEVIANFKDEIDAVIIGASTSNVPSTIVLVDDEIHIIREGKITKQEIMDALKEDK